MGIQGLKLSEEAFKVESDSEFALLMRTQKQEVGLALIGKLLEITPADEGEARRAWHFAAPRPDGQDRQTADPLAELIQITTSSEPEEPLYLENNAEHILVLEDGTFDPPNPGPSKDPRPGRRGVVLVQGGFSLQAPRGISGDALDAVASQFGLQKVETSF